MDQNDALHGNPLQRETSPGELTEPQKVKEATRAYKTESDMLAEWIDECCDQGGSYQSTPNELYSCYRNWCEVSGVKAMAKAWLGRLLKERGFDSTRTEKTDFG